MRLSPGRAALNPRVAYFLLLLPVVAFLRGTVERYYSKLGVGSREGVMPTRHLERMPVTLSASFGSGSTDAEILRCAQDDRQDTSQARSREVLSPNVLPWCAIRSRFCGHDVDAVGDNHTMYFVTRSEEGDR